MELFLFILTIVRRTKHSMWRKFEFFIKVILLRTVASKLESKPVVQLCVCLISRINNDSSPGTNIKNSTVDQEF